MARGVVGEKASGDEGMKIQLILIGWACMTICLVSYTAAFSHGASLAACNDMRPKHIRAQPQNPKKNYVTIYTNRSFYLPGDRVPVTVRSTRDFMGFLLQARTVSNDHIAGTFVYIPPGSKQLGCFKDGDAVTHSDKALKRNLSFVWRAPDKPIGDIKFCLSVVQSYFVYWARIESAIVFDPTNNKTSLTREDEAGVIMATPLYIPFTVTGNISGDKVSDRLNISKAQDVNSLVDNKAGTMTGAIVLQPVTSAFDREYVTDVQSRIKTTTISSEEFVRLPVKKGVQEKSNQNDHHLEPSRQPQEVATPIRSPGFQNGRPLAKTTHRTGRFPGFGTTPLCSQCGKDMTVLPLGPDPALGSSENDHTRPPSSSFQDTSWPLPAGKVLQLSHKHESNVSTQVPSRERVEGQPVTKKVSANFLQQSEQAAPGQTGGEEAGQTPPWMTRPVNKLGDPAKGGENPRRGMHLAAAQLGILLGCSAALGMALAAGLRCIHAQYCHKRTEVSFSEPDTNVITVRESGDMMEFRKVRENSFVLVQAEYNWITPSSNGKKQ
ncbi:reelin domain-containing protein 1 isoform X2 [Pleurodeles waltl]|uniref:reelin domain-containing protein 1 isoform X2 n=1 Tax=Pleurodeles waltl TaxID=8319 RepID=UPI003709C083